MATQSDDAAIRTGSFRYMNDTAEPSLLRNGKVLTRRNPDGNDAQWVGFDVVRRDMEVIDARQMAAAPTLEHNGFELQTHPLPDASLNFLENDQVLQGYYPHCEQVIKDATGAAVVKAFDHNVRSAQGKKKKDRIDGGQQVQGPAHMVHGDYTMTSAPTRLRDLTNPPKANDTIAAILGEGETLMDSGAAEAAIADGRFAIINLWRNIAEEPVATHPMALCDAACVDPKDLVVFEIHYEDRIGENYFAKHSDQHKWYFYPAMTRDEALLIKQWDSEGRMARTRGAEGDAADEPCTFSFHSAFEDPGTPEDAPDRWSIEVRCMVLYD